MIIAISKINHNLKQITLFHIDRGKEFDNKFIDKVLKTFEIEHSLDTKDCPYDNAVVEATMKALKTEFVKQVKFDNLEPLETELFDYVNWCINFRPRAPFQYLTPVALKDPHIKMAKKLLTFKIFLLSCIKNINIYVKIK